MMCLERRRSVSKGLLIQLHRVMLILRRLSTNQKEDVSPLLVQVCTCTCIPIVCWAPPTPWWTPIYWLNIAASIQACHKCPCRPKYFAVIHLSEWVVRVKNNSLRIMLHQGLAQYTYFVTNKYFEDALCMYTVCVAAWLGMLYLIFTCIVSMYL